MTKQKAGLLLFTAGILYAVIMGLGASLSISSALNNSTLEEINNTIWKIPGVLFIFWALSVPLGAVLAGCGALLYSGAKTLNVWLVGIGVVLVIFLVMFFIGQMYYPPLFGIGGTVILLSFFAIVWLWMKGFKALDNQERISRSFQMIGYVFFAIASWFICGELGSLHQPAFANEPPGSPMDIMTYLVLGWVCIFIGSYIGNGKSMRLKPQK